MKMNKIKDHDIDKYISDFPEDARKMLKQIRATIRKAAPEAEETISYGMPAFKLNGMLVFYDAWKNHIGFYPTPSGIKAFKKDLSIYETSKGAVQFPFDKPLPIKTILKIVKFRVEENLKKKTS